MTPEEFKELGINPYGTKKESTPPATPPKEREFKYSQNAKTVEEKRAELEIKRLEYEEKKLEADIKKLEAPSTSIDYFNQMLLLQKENNQQILSMQQANFETQLKLAKLEAGFEGGDSTMQYLEIFKEIVPLIAQSKMAPPQKINNPEEIKNDAIEEAENKAKETSKQISRKGGKMDFTNAKQIEEKRKDIREGRLSEADAYKEFCESVPFNFRKNIGKAEFHKIYEDIKNSKD